MGELFSRILERIAERTKDSGSVIILPNAEVALSDSCFKPILAQAAKRIAFVDGGNAEILKAPNFSLQFIRLYATVHQDNKRVSQVKKEFYALIVADGKNGLTYEVETFDTDFSLQHSFEANDATLRTGMHLATPTAVADAVRTFAELSLAQEICNQLNKGDVLVRDGDLLPTATHANQYVNELKRVATTRGVLLCGLSKTTTILTDSGNSAAAALQRISPAGMWLYQPPGSSIAFVKLHPKSGHVFRLDVLRAEDARLVASALASQATDPVFLGYPYGLIEADQFAQVAGNETARLKLQVRAHGGTALNAHLAAVNAHDTLNQLG
jgi:hypothetical protein